jgi:hypothetical protein
MHSALVEWGVKHRGMERGRVVETLRTDNETRAVTAAPADLVVGLTTPTCRRRWLNTCDWLT